MTNWNNADTHPPRSKPARLHAAGWMRRGGGGGGTEAPARTSAATYTFVRPKLGAHLVFAQKLTGNLNNTVNRTMVRDVTAVNADGSFTVHEEDPASHRSTHRSFEWADT
jgi:hypothetical protein